MTHYTATQNRFPFAVYEPVEFEDGIEWVQVGAFQTLAIAERYTDAMSNCVVRNLSRDIILIVKKGQEDA